MTSYVIVRSKDAKSSWKCLYPLRRDHQTLLSTDSPTCSSYKCPSEYHIISRKPKASLNMPCFINIIAHNT